MTERGDSDSMTVAQMCETLDAIKAEMDRQQAEIRRMIAGVQLAHAVLVDDTTSIEDRAAKARGFLAVVLFT